MSDSLIVSQGTNLDLIFKVTDDAGSPFHLTSQGYTQAAMQARPGPRSSVVMLDLSVDNGKIVIEPGGATGEVHINATGVDTLGVDQNGVYDCLAWNPGSTSDVVLIGAGRIIAQRRVTHKP